MVVIVFVPLWSGFKMWWSCFIFLQYGDTALHTAARYGHAGVTRILISARCSLNEQNKVTKVAALNNRLLYPVFNACSVQQDNRLMLKLLISCRLFSIKNKNYPSVTIWGVFLFHFKNAGYFQILGANIMFSKWWNAQEIVNMYMLVINCCLFCPHYQFDWLTVVFLWIH